MTRLPPRSLVDERYEARTPPLPRIGHCRYACMHWATDPERVCLAGVRFADRRLKDKSPIWNAEPCSPDGRANGATCDKLDLYTAAEVEAHDREVTEWSNNAIQSVTSGVCATCGATMQRAGTAFRCPTGCVSGFACGPKDIGYGGDE